MIAGLPDREYRRLYQREWRRRNPESARKSRRAYYLRNKKQYRDANNRTRARLRAIARAARENPCMDCGGSFPWYVMEFDHVRGEKKFNIGVAAVQSSKALKDELAKCDLVCANCHLIRTYKRTGGTFQKGGAKITSDLREQKP